MVLRCSQQVTLGGGHIKTLQSSASSVQLWALQPESQSNGCPTSEAQIEPGEFLDQQRAKWNTILLHLVLSWREKALLVKNGALLGAARQKA